MKVTECNIEGILLLQPPFYEDSRGYFSEVYRQKGYQKAGIRTDFVQDNMSISYKGVIRGLHYQYPHGQAKLVQVLAGAVYDVSVDIRKGSPTFGKWHGTVLSDENRHQVYIPEGFAHGFCVISQQALLLYKCSNYYNPECEHGINWSDPSIQIDWPEKNPILSDKDARLPDLDGISSDNLPG